jgi:hypothetical protein
MTRSRWGFSGAIAKEPSYTIDSEDMHGDNVINKQPCTLGIEVLESFYLYPRLSCIWLTVALNVSVDIWGRWTLYLN